MLSDINRIGKANKTMQKDKQVKKKQVKFGFVETKYYERMPGFVTNKENVQIICSYEPFTTTKEKFKDLCANTAAKKETKWSERTENNTVNINHQYGENMNEFYNIRGVSRRRYLILEDRLRLLLEGGVERREIEKAIDEQVAVTVKRRIREEIKKAKKYRESGISKAECEEELEFAFFDDEEKQDLLRLLDTLEDDYKKLVASHNKLMTDILFEKHQEEIDEANNLTQNKKDLG